MGNEGNINSFITPTIVTNYLNCQDNRNTIAFESHVPEANKQINAHLAEIGRDQKKPQRPAAMITKILTDASLKVGTHAL